MHLRVTNNHAQGESERYRCEGWFTLAQEQKLTGLLRLQTKKSATDFPLGLFQQIELRLSGQMDLHGKTFTCEGRAYGHHTINIAVQGKYSAPSTAPSAQ